MNVFYAQNPVIMQWKQMSTVCQFEQTHVTFYMPAVSFPRTATFP